MTFWASSSGDDVGELLYTSVDRDGMLAGVDAQEARAVAEAAEAGSFIYSGGVGSLEDLRGARSARCA